MTSEPISMDKMQFKSVAQQTLEVLERIEKLLAKQAHTRSRKD